MIRFDTAIRTTLFSATLAFGFGLTFDATASGSYAPPKVRAASQSAKIELYHLGKRLVLKRLNPTATTLSEQEQERQLSKLNQLNELIQQKHLKGVALGHLGALQTKEFQAVVVYLTTRYGVAPQ